MNIELNSLLIKYLKRELFKMYWVSPVAASCFARQSQKIDFAAKILLVVLT